MNKIEKHLSSFLSDEKCRITVRKAGTYRFPNSYIYKAHSHVEYEINYVASGNCVMIFGEEYIPLKKGECIVISPFENHGFLVDTKNGCKIWQAEMSILLSEKMIKKLSGDHEQNMHFKIKDCEDVIPLIDQIARYHRNEKNDYYTTLLNLSVLQLMVALKHHKEKSEDMSGRIENKKITGIMQYLQKHYNEPIQLEELAKEWNISSRYVRKYFAEEIGMSCTDYLTVMRMNRAKELLWESSKSVTDVAMEIGYGTPQYFCKVFKKEVGISPTAYRSVWREEQLK